MPQPEWPAPDEYGPLYLALPAPQARGLRRDPRRSSHGRRLPRTVIPRTAVTFGLLVWAVGATWWALVTWAQAASLLRACAP